MESRYVNVNGWMRVKRQFADDYERLRWKMVLCGERLRKKHGYWYRINAYDNKFLLLDSWNGHIYLHGGCESTGDDNIYNVHYSFTGYIEALEDQMYTYWSSYITPNHENQ
jgi:hypothetical protein